MHLVLSSEHSLHHHHSHGVEQTPGDILVLSASDSDLSVLAAAYDRLNPCVSLRLANLLDLTDPETIQTYVDQVVAKARLVIVRVLGGRGYWSYGIESIRSSPQLTAFMPGDSAPDPELSALSTLDSEAVDRLWRYLVYGGIDNATHFLLYAQTLIENTAARPSDPRPFPPASLYWPTLSDPSLERVQELWHDDRAVVALIFYRALLQAGNMSVIDALIHNFLDAQINVLPIAVLSLKDSVAASVVEGVLTQVAPAVILNATAFAVGKPDRSLPQTPFHSCDCPVLQVIFSGSTESDWASHQNGLTPQDIAMNVALPEVDGRLITRAVSFKSDRRYHHPTECFLTRYREVQDRIAYVVDLSRAWIRLRQTPVSRRRVAIILANYPNRDGRLANGVGLDTPQSVVETLRDLERAGYGFKTSIPESAELMTLLQSGVTNDRDRKDRVIRQTFSLEAYEKWFATLPQTPREQILARWGSPAVDPWIVQNAFSLPLLSFGNAVVAIQPARGYNIDPVASYHDPKLVPPHHYLAFYAWIRQEFQADALIHFGKHGNLEWLPGKALALSAACFPDVILGPIPHLYPFIVNDPGEGSQAKRRTAAVILDHMTPPLGRAETSGPLTHLEHLLEEYYQAVDLDPRRLPWLREQILHGMQLAGLDRDCSVSDETPERVMVQKLDTFLCEIKELQIRTGLHIFGRLPSELTELLLALVRVPRGDGREHNASLTQALALDLGLDFDPLDLDSPPPQKTDKTWKHLPIDQWYGVGHAIEWIEDLAYRLIQGTSSVEKEWTESQKVLSWIEKTLRPLLTESAASEKTALLRALDGGFIPPGPAGAPTRGRHDVFPTGRNFYSVDPRAIPTSTAYALGWKSAALILEKYRQEHQTYPEKIALSAWGTANMRTGGDDIAQALALMGVRPTWDSRTGHVTGFEILPLSLLDRPRVDVTLRISGFFRDAFPYQIALLDQAITALSARIEEGGLNPLASRVRDERTALIDSGLSYEQADRQARYRVFGSAPGAYGAGLQALIDEGGWSDQSDLTAAFIEWGGYAYGVGVQGSQQKDLFKRRLSAIQLVLHNQDNREHDLLDSDDYYQFEGGLTVAVTTLSGQAPTVYHNDHSRPDTPRIQTLEQEISRIVWGRAVNPKWIQGMRNHGYKGAFEMVATVDYLFAFAATTNAVKDHHFDIVYQTYLEDPAVREFIETANPAALREMARRFLEAQSRNLWKPQSNSAYTTLSSIVEGGCLRKLPSEPIG